MAFWGEAMTYTHPVWIQQDLAAARAVLARLGATPEARLAKAKTERERDYLRAVEILYGDGTKEERDFRYADAMAALHQRYPDDVDATAFYALSLLGTAHEGRDFAIYMRSAALLEEVFPTHQHHPGVLHYLIHSYDDPVHAPLGMRAARLYGSVAPNAGHALHMTSHIFVAARPVGRRDRRQRAGHARRQPAPRGAAQAAEDLRPLRQPGCTTPSSRSGASTRRGDSSTPAGGWPRREAAGGPGARGGRLDRQLLRGDAPLPGDRDGRGGSRRLAFPLPAGRTLAPRFTPGLWGGSGGGGAGDPAGASRRRRAASASGSRTSWRRSRKKKSNPFSAGRTRRSWCGRSTPSSGSGTGRRTRGSASCGEVGGRRRAAMPLEFGPPRDRETELRAPRRRAPRPGPQRRGGAGLPHGARPRPRPHPRAPGPAPRPAGPGPCRSRRRTQRNCGSSCGRRRRGSVDRVFQVREARGLSPPGSTSVPAQMQPMLLSSREELMHVLFPRSPSRT